MLLLRVRGLLVVCVWWGCVSSSQLGPDNCTATVAINKPLSNTVTVYVPSGTACFECIVDGVIATDATFQIGNSPVSEGSVVNGTLVVSDTESFFSTPAKVQCGSGSEITHAAFVEHTIFRAPLIMGDTTVNEGDTLHLMCDSSNSRPLPLVHWLSPDGDFLVYGPSLVIINITRDVAGTYTCVANQFTLTMNSSVEIIVHFPCDVLKSTDMIIVNMSSTAVGSTATYQCRDGPTDVYTTQCTSTGVWDPHPLSTLDCSKETVSCERLNSTDTVIVMMSSTAVGSTATYQCRDGPTDVYTTQCTSTGVWDPSPDCTSKETGQTSTLQPCQIGVIILSLIVLVQTVLLIGALVKIVLLTKKGSEQKTREERLEMDVNVAYCTPKEIMSLRTSKKQ